MKMEVWGGAINHTSIILYSTVNEEAITHNPAYEEGILWPIRDLLTLSHFSHYIQWTDLRWEGKDWS